ncbi:hypothetical protein O9X81_03110 [Agrobacterium salinitolerans]|nr:hypothetical protein [Agrobacterium salinitolerans]MCZ7855592.1 hypothetical protein [Agrobacterium salinitolerans]
MDGVEGLKQSGRAVVKRMTHPLSIIAGTSRPLRRSIAAELKLRETNYV